jgi:hypothetical protein
MLATTAGFVATPCARANSQEPLASASPAQDSGQDNNAHLPWGAQSNSSGSGLQPPTAVVLRFAVASQPIVGTSVLSAQACPQTGSAATSATTTIPSTGLTVNTKIAGILDTISREMETKLSKKMFVTVDPDPSAIQAGALVISGCITRADSGNSAKRLIGMNVGASRLNVHVVALTRTKDGWSSVDTFDIQVKGGNILPPIGPAGLALNAARDTRLGLSADGKKLADRILKKLSKDVNTRERPAKA